MLRLIIKLKIVNKSRKQSEETGIRTLSPLKSLDKARHIVPTALLVIVQRLRSYRYKAVKGRSTRPIVLSTITGSYWRRRVQYNRKETQYERLYRITVLDAHMQEHNTRWTKVTCSNKLRRHTQCHWRQIDSVHIDINKLESRWAIMRQQALLSNLIMSQTACTQFCRSEEM